MGVQLRKGDLLASRAIRIAREQLSKAIKLVEGDGTSDRDEMVHGVRKRIKKSRALILLARGSVGRKAIEKVDRRLREAARPLSRARDASVLIATLDALAGRSVGLVPAVAFDEARQALLEHRDRVIRDELEEGDALPKFTKALRSTRRQLMKWDLGDRRSDPAEAFKRAYKRGREAYEIALGEASVEALHELRKRAKAFVYQLRILDSDSTGPFARLERLATLLSDELGELHDLDVLRQFLSGRVGATPVLTTLDRRRLDLRRVVLQRAGVVFFDKPREFSKTLAASEDRLETVGGKA